MRHRSAPGRSSIAALNVPKLSIGGPLAISFTAVALLAGAGVYAAQHYKIAEFASVDANLVVDDAATIVRAPTAGRAVHFYVEPGDLVKSGQLLARIDDNALDDKIASLTSQAAATRWRLRTIRAKIAQALKAPQPGSKAAQEQIASLTAQTGKIEKMARQLMKRVVAAEQESLKGEIYANASGRVEMRQWHDQAPTAGGSVEILKLVRKTARLAVKALLPASLLHAARSGAMARVVVSDLNGRKFGPVAAHMKRAGGAHEPAGGPQTRPREVIFEIDLPRSQIAKHIELHSGLTADVLLEVDRRSLLQQLLTIAL